jgi:hypothetical protein
MTQYLMIACAVLALALGGVGFLLKREIAKTAVAEDRVKTLEADAKRTAKVTTKRAKAEQAAKPKAEKKAQDLGAALSKAPAWADQPLPQEVRDALAQ